MTNVDAADISREMLRAVHYFIHHGPSGPAAMGSSIQTLHALVRYGLVAEIAPRQFDVTDTGREFATSPIKSRPPVPRRAKSRASSERRRAR